MGFLPNISLESKDFVETWVFKEIAETDLRRNPLKLGDFMVKQPLHVCYLVQVLHCGGLGGFAEATVEENVGRIKGEPMEVKAIIEDCSVLLPIHDTISVTG